MSTLKALKYISVLNHLKVYTVLLVKTYQYAEANQSLSHSDKISGYISYSVILDGLPPAHTVPHPVYYCHHLPTPGGVDGCHGGGAVMDCESMMLCDFHVLINVGEQGCCDVVVM